MTADHQAPRPPAAAGPPASAGGTAAAGALRELAGLLREVTGESGEWAGRITPTTRLEDDLRLESVEFAALSERIEQRYGTGVDLTAYLSGLDVDELIALTVGDLLGLIGGSSGARGPAR